MHIVEKMSGRRNSLPRSQAAQPPESRWELRYQQQVRQRHMLKKRNNVYIK